MLIAKLFIPFETRITDKIVHPVPITEPVEDGLPLENGYDSDAAN